MLGRASIAGRSSSRSPIPALASTRHFFPTCSIASARRTLRAPVPRPGLAWAWRSFVTWSSFTEATCAPRATAVMPEHGSSSGCHAVQASLTARDGRKPASTAATPAATDVPRFDGLRILIVDDDRESCEMMLEALRGYGASVRCAMSASDAAAASARVQTRYRLSDIAMPGRDGYAVLSEVRAVETVLGRRVPVAAVSAYAHAEDRERAIAAGFDHYLAKPVDPAALASTVKALAANGNRQLNDRME